ncbi:hypothetical protein BGV52_21805 [Burkholderia ubonensis]|uniref:hypothetical protein n=1 Tax=Burkholderia ubonensis TaxID=101571 RepID=UPI0008FDFF1D|nr:hypothetical protein [Burkholderia ubonensis]OJB06925.1 hypothetical protein BGV52_21805 [Burkholderia ubonensis]
MARTSAKKPPARPAPRHVDAAVFSVAMRSGDVEVIGIPFEHRGRSWAAYAIVGLPTDAAPFYTNPGRPSKSYFDESGLVSLLDTQRRFQCAQ